MVSPLKVVEGNRDGMDKSKALDAAVSQIERAFGKGSIMRLGRDGKVVEIPTISTGSLGLDMALGVGGLPRGRIVEIYGPESSGKTTLADRKSTRLNSRHATISYAVFCLQKKQ